MKKSLKIVLAVIAILIIIGAIVFGIKKNSNHQQVDNHPTQIENGQEIVKLPRTYTSLETLPANYTVSNAVKDKCLVMDTDGIKNREVLDDFLADVEEKQNSNLRIAYALPEGKLLLLDVTYYDGDKMVVCEDNSRSGIEGSGEIKIGIVKNEYDLKTDYRFSYRDSKLEDDSIVTEYFLSSLKGDGEEVALFAIGNSSLSKDDFKKNEFEATVKSIVGPLMMVEPLKSTAEYNVSPEIYITLENDGTFNGVSFEEGEKIKVTYNGQITEIAEMYQMQDITSIEKR